MMPKSTWALRSALPAALMFAMATGCQPATGDDILADGRSGNDWAGYGAGYNKQHFSPLAEIDEVSVSRLGLVWAMDLAPGNAVTQPLAIDGIVYIATGYSVVSAIDAVSGKLQGRYDPKVTEVAGRLLRTGWGSRGVAWSDGTIVTATLDGRLISRRRASPPATGTN